MYKLVNGYKFFNVTSDVAYNNPIYNTKFKIAIKEHKLNSES